MLNTLNVNLNTDLKVSRVPELGIKIKSQDINNNLFILRFTDKGKVIELDETYTVEILTKFEKSKSHRLTSAVVYRDYARWEFDTSFITQDEKVTNYVYVRKSGSLVVSADANAFAFDVGLSEIDKDAGRVAEVYDENYEKVLADYSGALDERTTEKLDEAVADFNQRGDAEIADWRVGADSELAEVLADKVVIKNLVANGDFSQGINPWLPIGAGIESFIELNQLKITTTLNNLRVYTLVNAIANHKYYLSVLRSWSETAEVGPPHFYINNSIPILNLGTSPNEETVSALITSTLNGNQMSIFPRSTTAVLTIDDVIFLDLTEIFGVGNEPSKAEMDELIKITGYFDEITLTQKQILNWQLKLIRQNRNALIALGGTII